MLGKIEEQEHGSWDAYADVIRQENTQTLSEEDGESNQLITLLIAVSRPLSVLKL